MKKSEQWKFVSMMRGDVPVISETFEGAWDAMYKWVDGLLQEGAMTYQVLETAIWIETPSGTPMDFYASRDFAIANGWSQENGWPQPA